MSLPKPEAGLVIRYSYLWMSEFEESQEDGGKIRPCAIVVAVSQTGKSEEVVVLPVTHAIPAEPEYAMEIPAVTKRRLGLDEGRSWVVFSESNAFTWPGPDLRRIGNVGNESVAYGKLPPNFANELIRRFKELEAAGQSKRVPRTE